MVAGGRRNNKSTIPAGSLASQGLIPGTTHEFFNRLFKEFMQKHCNVTPLKRLSDYQIAELSDIVFPEVVAAEKEDRINKRRKEANSSDVLSTLLRLLQV